MARLLLILSVADLLPAGNYDDIEAAKNYANSACGTHCAIISFGEDFAYVALSDDDRVSRL